MVFIFTAGSIYSSTFFNQDTKLTKIWILHHDKLGQESEVPSSFGHSSLSAMDVKDANAASSPSQSRYKGNKL